MMFWFFSTPIIYPYFLPSVAKYYWFFRLNPFFHLAVSYQEVLFFHGGSFAHGGHLKWLLVLGAASCVFFLMGYWVFDRLRDSFAETV
jgi:ABC-type polysaccharide/polyol phosphate export permease